MEIHLAIPSYNNATGLKKLLPQAVLQDFASITVLDDGSTDDTSKVVEMFSGVKYIKSNENHGSVAAKNLILKQLPQNGWLLFIDSDMEIITDDIPAKLQDFSQRHTEAGAGVRLIKTHDGSPMRFNKGFDLNPLRMVLAMVFYAIMYILPSNFALREFVRKLSSPFSMDFHTIKEEKVDWAVEGFFFVKVSLFKKFGGYDSRFIRNHEGPDLCLRLRQAGHQIWFFPGIIIQDHDQHSHSNFYRRYHWWRSLIIYYYKNPSRLLIWHWPNP
ncbi:glycosyltransferase family 2 protein [Candidatus Nomurabacteria bacterium]|nr:glycosyltransferase family 2 protein [Candidatus Nomurabacteria bacterium]